MYSFLLLNAAVKEEKNEHIYIYSVCVRAPVLARVCVFISSSGQAECD